MSGRGLVIARRPWRLAASGGLPWAGLQLRLMTLDYDSVLRLWPTAMTRKQEARLVFMAGLFQDEKSAIALS
ncbi:hypothetical protein DENIT_20073 [Pseudomonas veronii]|nr:hypothetical protein DENIT_20073 [Pseudomonas veronii]